MTPLLSDRSHSLDSYDTGRVSSDAVVETSSIANDLCFASHSIWPVDRAGADRLRPSWLSKVGFSERGIHSASRPTWARWSRTLLGWFIHDWIPTRKDTNRNGFVIPPRRNYGPGKRLRSGKTHKAGTTGQAIRSDTHIRPVPGATVYWIGMRRQDDDPRSQACP